jgi:hypothetical protein
MARPRSNPKVFIMTMTRFAAAFAACCVFACSSLDVGNDPSMYLTGTEELAQQADGGGWYCPSPKKVLVCHIPPGNPANAHTICVGAPAVKAHEKNHGDSVGACTPATANGGCDSSETLLGSEAKPVKGPHNAQACTGKKVLICHIPPGNPANAHTICIGRPAEPAHVRNHGDALGACAVEPAAPPSGDQCLPPEQACTTPAECDGNLCLNGVCKVPNGGDCTSPNQCGSGRCANKVCEGVPPGGSCQVASQCASGVCTAGTCAPTQTLPPGGGADAGTGTQPPLVEGGSCTSNVQCASQACVAATCTGGLPAGSSCGSGADCSSTICESGTCAGGGVPNGGACSADGQCVSTQCNLGFCEGRADGTVCTDHAQCGSNDCAGGLCAPIIN